MWDTCTANTLDKPPPCLTIPPILEDWGVSALQQAEMLSQVATNTPTEPHIGAPPHSSSIRLAWATKVGSRLSITLPKCSRSLVSILMP